MQGMGESYGALVVDVDQAVGLQAFEDAQVEVVGGRRQGVGEGEEFEGLALVGVDAADDVSRAFAHGRGQGQRAAPGLFVRARDLGEQALFAQGTGQVAQQPEVAVAQSVQPVHGERLQSATGTRCGQPVRLLVRQRLQGEAGQQLTGPQPGHRAGHRYVVRGHDQQPGAALHRQLVDQGGRGVVEEMCVVDQQGPYGGEQLHRLVQGDRLGQQVRERGEGDVPGLGRAGRLGAVRAADRLRDEPGLATARGSRHHDAVPARAQGPADQFQFVLPAGERPGQLKGLRVPFVSRHVSKSTVTHT